MSTRPLFCSTSALAMIAACAVSSPALADEAAQETGAVAISADANASANTTAPHASHSRRHSNGVGNLRFLAGMHFGFGGNLEVDADNGLDFNDDLDPTIGLHGGVDYVLMDYFALGGELRLSWWKPDNNFTPLQDDPGRSLFVDFNLKPRGRYAFDKFPLEVYGTLPFGLSFASTNDDIAMDGGVGFNLGFGGGALYFFNSRFGVNMEMLGVWHWFDGEVEIGNIDIDTDSRTAQFYWMLSGVFAI